MANPTIIESTAVPVGGMTLLGVLRIPAVRQILLLVGIAAAVAAGFAAFFWSQSPNYAPLYARMDSTETAQISEALRSAGIEYKLDGGSGGILVPASRLHEIRLELASQGLPAGAAAGMTSIQDQSSFGVSQFMEGARYQYALEAELARTISHIGAVADARVHLALPKQSAFLRERRSGSASVLLQLLRGHPLEADQASAIVNLVASSVPNLDPKNVTVIDQHGRLLSSGSSNWADAQTVNQFRITQKIEESYKRRIEEILSPLVGPGRVQAQVSAVLDFTVTEETRESFDPANAVVRSEQINEEQKLGDSATAEGVPGALSNQPPETAAAEGDPAATTESELVNSSRSATRNFELDRTVSRTRPQPGTIQRLSVAVLIDDRVIAGGGETAAAGDGDDATSAAGAVPLTAEEIDRYTSLVKEAVGFNEARGDSVVVLNETFHSPPELPAAEEPPIWKQPVVRDVMQQGAGIVLVIILAFGIVRPMLRGLVSANNMSSAQYITSGEASFSGGQPVPQLAEDANALPSPSFDEKVAAAKNMTGHDPARVAQVVRKWVAEDE